MSDPMPVRRLFEVPAFFDSPEREAEIRREREAEEAHKRSQAREAERKRLHDLRIPLTGSDERALIDGTVNTDFGPSIRAVSAWLEEREPERPWLVLCGTTGRGKTLAAAWMLHRAGGRYMTARDLERMHVTRFGEEVDEYRAERMRRRPLVLDELGTEQDTTIVTAALLDLVDCRRGEGHRTIAIANMSEAALRARYPDARLWSRLAECTTWVPDAGPDMRKGRR